MNRMPLAESRQWHRHLTVLAETVFIGLSMVAPTHNQSLAIQSAVELLLTGIRHSRLETSAPDLSGHSPAWGTNRTEAAGRFRSPHRMTKNAAHSQLLQDKLQRSSAVLR
jgi:hypothetical protein